MAVRRDAGIDASRAASAACAAWAADSWGAPEQAASVAKVTAATPKRIS
jgi:hypothetical protein